MKYSLLLLAMLLLSDVNFGVTNTYSEITGKMTIVYSIVIQPAPGGAAMTIEYSPGEWQRLTVDTSNHIRTLTCFNEKKTNNFTASRKGNTLTVQGICGGRNINWTNAIDGNPWIQPWGTGLEKFVLGSDKEVLFWSLSLDEPSQTTLMKARKVGPQERKVNGKTLTAEHVQVFMSGPMELLWKADFWFRQDDGRHVADEMVRGMNVPVTVTELTGEK